MNQKVFLPETPVTVFAENQLGSTLPCMKGTTAVATELQPFFVGALRKLNTEKKS